MTPAMLGIVGAGVVLVGLLVMIVVLRRMLYIAQPNEVLVLSGVRRTGARGRLLTYRTVRGGRLIRMPLLNRVDRLDLTVHDIELTIDDVLARDFVPCVVRGSARVKIAGDQPAVDNAVRGLMGLRREEVEELARELLDGTVRRVFTSLRPVEVDADRERFAMAVIEELDADFTRLGLVIDTFTVHSIDMRAGGGEALPHLGKLGVR